MIGDAREGTAREERRPNEDCFCYGKVRSQIRTGDIFLFRGRSPLSRFIQWGSKSPYSHAGMAAWWGRLAVFQAVARGAEFTSMSSAVYNYEGQVDWWSLKPEHDCKLDRAQFVDTAFEQLGKKYGYGALVRLIFRMTLQRFRFTPDPLAHPSTLFCSEYVSLCYRAGGFDIRPDAADDCTSPGDLATSGYLDFRGALHRKGEKDLRTTDDPARRLGSAPRAARAPAESPREAATL